MTTSQDDHGSDQAVSRRASLRSRTIAILLAVIALLALPFVLIYAIKFEFKLLGTHYLNDLCHKLGIYNALVWLKQTVIGD